VHLEVDEIVPRIDPLIEERSIGALHYLVAAREVGCHPAVDIRQSIGRQSPLAPKAIVHRRGVAVTKMLNDHEQHIAPRIVQAFS